MAIRRKGVLPRQIRTLFNVGAIGELTDGQLLERFAQRDAETAELAFAVLVERHGPMVMRVCRSVLRDSHGAQDAFQATFLVLVKKARALWVSDSLGPWLYQVAYRTSCRARATTARRRKHEARLSERSTGVAIEEPGMASDWAPVLHEEIARLPERYRVPLVLCEFGGRTHEQAARHLGWPVGTVKSRLTRGRERLRDRLSRRGLAPGVLPLLISPLPEVTAAIPPALAEALIRGARPFATARASAGLPGSFTSSVISLTHGVLKIMVLTKLQIAVLGALSAGLVVTGVGILAGQGPAIEPGRAPVPVNAAKITPDAGVKKRRGDLVADEIRFVRGQLESGVRAERELRAELSSLRVELAERQAKLKETQAQEKEPAEIEAFALHVQRLQSNVDRQELLLKSVQERNARYQAMTTPGDIVSIAVSRSTLREMRDRLMILRDSMRLILRQDEQDYQALRMNGGAKGDPKEQVLRLRLDKTKDAYNTLLDQLKSIQLIYDRADSRPKA